MKFAEYANSPIFEKLIDIREFSLVAEIPPIQSLADQQFSNRLAYQIYEQLREVVKAAGFYYEDHLEVSKGANRVTVEYRDDQYNFGVICSEEMISIRRQGSQLGSFHDWYTALMPSAQGILTNISAVLSKELGRG